VKWLALTALAGCQLVFDYEGVSFDGAYQTVVVNGENGCAIQLWTVGAEDVVDVNIQQRASDVSITVFGNTGDLVMTVYGERTFDGTIDGLAITATRDRAEPLMMNNCMVFPTIVLEGQLDADRGVIEGTLTHEQDHVGAGCPGLCTSVQTFRATRK
jgi:hypothetical protein